MSKNNSNYSKGLIVPQPGFADQIPTLYAPQKEYVIKVVPLMLEHAWQRKNTNKTTALDELLYSGWICRLITLDRRVLNRDTYADIPGWPEVLEHLTSCLDECANEAQVPGTVTSCMARIQPILEGRFQEKYVFPKRMFHSWWYTIHDDNTHLALHLINAYQPDSPFKNLGHFLSTMLQAVRHAIAAYPAIRIVSCGSWLNRVEKFQQCWPPGFAKNQKILNETGGFGPGAWGQYMTTAGGFSESKAAVLRQLGVHPYALTEALCPVGEVIAHLETLVS